MTIIEEVRIIAVWNIIILIIFNHNINNFLKNPNNVKLLQEISVPILKNINIKSIDKKKEN